MLSTIRGISRLPTREQSRSVWCGQTWIRCKRLPHLEDKGGRAAERKKQQRQRWNWVVKERGRSSRGGGEKEGKAEGDGWETTTAATTSTWPLFRSNGNCYNYKTSVAAEPLRPLQTIGLKDTRNTHSAASQRIIIRSRFGDFLMSNTVVVIYSDQCLLFIFFSREERFLFMHEMRAGEKLPSTRYPTAYNLCLLPIPCTNILEQSNTLVNQTF